MIMRILILIGNHSNEEMEVIVDKGYANITNKYKYNTITTATSEYV